jgi:glycogen debranching enzyme
LKRTVRAQPIADLVRLRPRDDTIHVSRGRTVLATARDGFLDGKGERGLIVHETRLLSRYRLTIGREEPRPVALSAVEQHRWLGYYVLEPPGTPPKPADTGSGGQPRLSENTLEIRIARIVGEGAHEDIRLTNYSRARSRFRLSLAVDGDFADSTELAQPPKKKARVRRRWRSRGARGGELALAVDLPARRASSGKRSPRLRRGLRLSVERADSRPRVNGGGRGFGFDVDLPPLGTWSACVRWIPVFDGKDLPTPSRCWPTNGNEGDYERLRRTFLRESARFRTRESEGLAPVVIGSLERARRDLAALRLYDLDHGDRSWTMAAGLPIYIALFGRDTLTASWQSAILGPEMMRGTLEELPRWQGRKDDPWRDEQPGRMLHEAHTGPLEIRNENPRARYYGSVTTSGFYPFVVAELWHWLGDRKLAAALVDPALEALAWLDRESDRNRDGFYDYLSRSTQGTKHQGWKDSGDAIVDERGVPIEPPIATCEEQAFAYAAKLYLSEVLWWIRRRDEAKRLFHEADELKKRFNDVFWMESEGFVAMGLGPDRRPIRSIASNAGHCLAAGILEASRAEKVADRLMEPELFSGWGVRTLSAKNPSYNPFSYHRGSVWPVEQGTFALGFFRYGLWDHLQTLARSQFEAAAIFDLYRLPEVLSGHPRSAEFPFPALYPRSNSPQAWSASALFCFLQAMLGLYPYAPLRLLIVDPHLPEWLPEITLEGLRVGRSSATIRFTRGDGGRSSYEVLEKRGTLHVVRQPSPWSLTAGFGERMRDVLTSLIP